MSYIIISNQQVLLLYFTHFLLFAENLEAVEELCTIIALDPNAQTLAGIDSTIQVAMKYLSFIDCKIEKLAELLPQNYNPGSTIHKPILAKEPDIKELFSFQQNISEFSTPAIMPKNFGQEITAETGRIYLIREGRAIVASATLTALNDYNGMVVGVATDSSKRRKGYAEACMRAICEYMVHEKKAVVLFYRNPTAGLLYKKIGFRDINIWSIASLRSRN